MEKGKVIQIMQRELRAYAQAMRDDWTDFGDRFGPFNAEPLCEWADEAVDGRTDEEFTAFSNPYGDGEGDEL